MAKTVKTQKKEVILLLNVWNRVAPDKMPPADTAKYVACRKALKKPIKDHLEERAEIEEERMKKTHELDGELEPLRQALVAAAEEKKEGLQAVLARQVAGANSQIEAYNKKIIELVDIIKDDEAIVTFDNEDFLYFSTYLKDNAPSLCTADIPERKDAIGNVIQAARKFLDAEAMEHIFDFLNLAQ